MTDDVQYFPSWRYFRQADGSIGNVVIKNAQEADALGPGYVDSPVRVPELAPVMAAAVDPAVPPTVDASPAAPAPKPRGRPKKIRSDA